MKFPHYPTNRVPLPAAGARQSIGLFGGSFDPLHAGHLLVMERALLALKLDWIWWLVTPGNPLKEHEPAHSLRNRLDAIGRAVRHPRSVALDIERGLGVRYTSDTVAMLRTIRPDLNFVWLMGADNLAGFHRWNDWRGIADNVPIAVIDRPGSNHASLSSMFAQTYRAHHVEPSDAALLPWLKAPAWSFVRGPLSPLSSSEIRQASLI